MRVRGLVWLGTSAPLCVLSPLVWCPPLRYVERCTCARLVLDLGLLDFVVRCLRFMCVLLFASLFRSPSSILPRTKLCRLLLQQIADEPLMPDL